MEVEMEDTEAQLLTYLQNILKYQIIPMYFMDLRDLVEDVPRKSILYEFIQDKYPGEQFLDFLRKYPLIFTLNPDRTVVLTANCFASPYVNANRPLHRDYDEVDGRDNEEYISNPSEDSDSEEAGSAAEEVESGNEETCEESHEKDGSSSSVADSSVQDMSSDIVQTSDSVASSLSSSSSVDYNSLHDNKELN